MTEGTIFNTGNGTRTHYTGPTLDTRPPDSQTGSIGTTILRHLLRVLFSCLGARKAMLRREIIRELMKARNQERCIDEILNVCTTEGGSDGLDVAIDILSKTGPLILAYAWEYLLRDIRNWNPSSERAYQPNDDYWYILLRAVARAEVPERERFRFVSCCATAHSRGIREGVVEGLRDLGTPAARQRLRRFAEEDPDELIQQIAREALADLES